MVTMVAMMADIVAVEAMMVAMAVVVAVVAEAAVAVVEAAIVVRTTRVATKTVVDMVVAARPSVYRTSSTPTIAISALRCVVFLSLLVPVRFVTSLLISASPSVISRSISTRVVPLATL